eukprot:UN12202
MNVLTEIKLKLDQNIKYVNELTYTSLKTEQGCDCQNIFNHLDDVIGYAHIMDIELKSLFLQTLTERNKANKLINNMEAKINNLNQQVSDLNKSRNKDFFNNINKVTYCLFDLKNILRELQKANEDNSLNEHSSENQIGNRQNKNLVLDLNGRCWNCEDPGHKSYDCPYALTQCPFCSHIGHNTPYECRMYWMARPVIKLHPVTATLTIYNIFGIRTEFRINIEYIPQHLNLKSVFKTIGLKYF